MKTNRVFGKKKEISFQQQNYFDHEYNNQRNEDFNESVENVEDFDIDYNLNNQKNIVYEEEGEQLSYVVENEELTPGTTYSNMKNIPQLYNYELEKNIKMNNGNKESSELPIAERIKNEFHFQPKIRNSGYWGKVYLRKGTWIVIVGFCLFLISTVLIGVFWGFWYSNALNYPMRILAITLLTTGKFDDRILSMYNINKVSNYFFKRS